jgi:hypothetical protein
VSIGIECIIILMEAGIEQKLTFLVSEMYSIDWGSLWCENCFVLSLVIFSNRNLNGKVLRFCTKNRKRYIRGGKPFWVAAHLKSRTWQKLWTACDSW